jgi:hypothetical protein
MYACTFSQCMFSSGSRPYQLLTAAQLHTSSFGIHQCVTRTRLDLVFIVIDLYRREERGCAAGQ